MYRYTFHWMSVITVSTLGLATLKSEVTLAEESTPGGQVQPNKSGLAPATSSENHFHHTQERSVTGGDSETVSHQVGTLYGESSCDFDDYLFACVAYASLGSGTYLYETGYDGTVDLKIKYWAKDECLGYFTDARFYVYVDGAVQKIDTCDGDCSGELVVNANTLPGSTTGSRLVKIKVKVDSYTDCSQTHEQYVGFTRPACPSSIMLNSIDNQPLTATQVSISGSVSDDGCGDPINSSSATVTIKVTEPDGTITYSSGRTVSNGNYSWTYNLPILRDRLGTYTVTASYNGLNDDHPLESSDTSSSVTFKVRKEVPVPTPPVAADHTLVHGLSGDYTGWVVYDYEDSHLYAIDIDLDLKDPMDVISLDIPDLSGYSMAATSDFTSPGRSDDYLYAVTYDGIPDIVFLDMDGQQTGYSWPVPPPLVEPGALAFDGQDLWVGSRMAEEPIVRIELATGEPLSEIWPTIGTITDLGWDEQTSTLLALSLENPNIYRLNPIDGAIIEELPLNSFDHRAVAAYEGEIWVGDFATKMFYMYGEPPAIPSGPQNVEAYSDETMPDSVMLTWIDPDQENPWDEIRIYRDGEHFGSVPPGVESFQDSGLEQFACYDYLVTTYRQEDGAESQTGDPLPACVGGPLPATIFVPQDYADIQAAINAARQGDTVLVEPGVYTHPLNFGGKHIRVQSIAGPLNTFLNGADHQLAVVRFENQESDQAVLSGFSLTEAQPNHTGVIYVGMDTGPTIENCIITSNIIRFGGGAIYCDAFSFPIINNCLIVDNVIEGGSGGGIYCVDGMPMISNCTIAGNWAQYDGGGIYSIGGGIPFISNSIVWDNLPMEIHAEACYPEMFYCDVQGGWPGEGNIDADPLFATGSPGDYYLSQLAAGQDQDSPCVDAGSDMTEMLGFTELMFTRTDGVGDIDLVDLGFHYFYVDCNSNGTSDEQDIFEAVSMDCNWNGVPDECEPEEDCNSNGVQDICDVADGFSEDCNQNDVPDECEFQGDNDSDGVIDMCDNCLAAPNGPQLGTCVDQYYLPVYGTICADDAECLVTAGEICSLNQEDFDLDGLGDACDFGHVYHLDDFPFDDAIELKLNAPAVAKMILDYINRGSEPPPQFTQEELYAEGLEAMDPPGTEEDYLDDVAMLAILQNHRPGDYQTYGYNFGRYYGTKEHLLWSICHWIDYEIDTPPGYPDHVPAAIPSKTAPSDDDFINWLAVLGIHTDQISYGPEAPPEGELLVYGFWINDPLMAGLGENSYKTSERLDAYYYPVDTVDYWGNPLENVYVGIFEPPATGPGEVVLASSPTQFQASDVKMIQLALPARSTCSASLPPSAADRIAFQDLTFELNPTAAQLIELADKSIVQAAIRGATEQLIPYDDNFAEVFGQTSPAAPLYVKNLEGSDYYAVPFVLDSPPANGWPGNAVKSESDSLKTAKQISELGANPEALNSSTPQLDLVAVVVLIDATDGHFMEASWVQQPIKYPQVSREEALQLIRNEPAQKSLKTDGDQKIIIQLVHRQGSSYYHPVWEVTIDGETFLVTQ